MISTQEKITVINIEIKTIEELEEKIKELTEKYQNEQIIFNISEIKVESGNASEVEEVIKNYLKNAGTKFIV